MRFLRKTRPRRRRAPQPGPGGQVARLSETIVAFACLFPCGIETAIAFADAGRASIETTIAFAGEKWVFLVHFSGAEVMPVSEVPCWGRAVVLLVSTSPRCRASVKSWGCAQVVDGLFVWLRCRWAAVGPGGSRRPIGGRREACWAWPGFETTRRAKLVARTASGRAGLAAVGDQAATRSN